MKTKNEGLITIGEILSDNNKVENITRKKERVIVNKNNPINKIGLEIECFIRSEEKSMLYGLSLDDNEYLANDLRDRGVSVDEIGWDSSIDSFPFFINGMYNANCFEIKLLYKYEGYIFIQKLEKAASVIFRHFEQNKSCGNHIHISWENSFKAAEELMKPDATEYFIRRYREEYKDSGKYISRLNNKYCYQVWEFESISDYLDYRKKNKHKEHRYSVINYESLFKHGTVEFRIMPHAEDWYEYVDQVEWLIGVVKEILYH